ncbi:unnamed protein product, partial [Phaeothamnion confervicola]
MLRFFPFLVIVSSAVQSGAKECHQFSERIESPCAKDTVKPSGYVTREYSADQLIALTDATIDGSSWDEASEQGFEKNFEYITRNEIPMTSPVLFRRLGGKWHVSFFVPSSFEKMEDIPKPKDPSVSIKALSKGARFAVVEFGGFAREGDYVAQAADLKAALAKDGVATVDPQNSEWAEIWAGYDSPFVLFNRHNEVLLQLA